MNSKYLFRTIVGVIAGMAAAFALVIGVELLSNIVHPFPEGFQETVEEICEHVKRYPAWVLAAVVPLWSLTAFVGSYIAGRSTLAAERIVSLLLAAGLALNLAQLPYPGWFKIACLVGVPVALGLSSFLTSRHRARSAAKSDG